MKAAYHHLDGENDQQRQYLVIDLSSERSYQASIAVHLARLLNVPLISPCPGEAGGSTPRRLTAQIPWTPLEILPAAYTHAAHGGTSKP